MTTNKQTSGIGSVLAKEWETAVRKALTPVLAGAGPGAMPPHSSHRYVSPSFHKFCFAISDKIWYFGRFLPFGQSYIYQVVQTIQMKLILLCVWAEPAVLGRAKTALKFKYEI